MDFLKSELQTLLRVIVPGFTVVYFIVAFIWRRYVVAKRIGREPVMMLKPQIGPEAVVSWAFRGIALGVLFTVTLFSFFPDIYAYLMPIPYLDYSILRIGGAVLCVLSLLLVATAQAQMGNAWRIGIDDESRAPLVDTGLFRYSRNPVYLGIMMALKGLFFILPNMLTFALIWLGWLALEFVIRLEEQFLRNHYGEAYRQYCRKVSRWI